MFVCPSQPVPPSPVDQSQVWLAVNEDGLCVLDYTMVCRLKPSINSVSCLVLVHKTKRELLATAAWLGLTFGGVSNTKNPQGNL